VDVWLSPERRRAGPGSPSGPRPRLVEVVAGQQVPAHCVQEERSRASADPSVALSAAARRFEGVGKAVAVAEAVRTAYRAAIAEVRMRPLAVKEAARTDLMVAAVEAVARTHPCAAAGPPDHTHHLHLALAHTHPLVLATPVHTLPRRLAARRKDSAPLVFAARAHDSVRTLAQAHTVSRAPRSKYLVEADMVKHLSRVVAEKARAVLSPAVGREAARVRMR